MNYPTDFCEYGTNEENAANAERIVACVNALAGINNPAAIKQLVEAARELLHTYVGFKPSAYEKVSQALAALAEPVPEAQQSPTLSEENR